MTNDPKEKSELYALLIGIDCYLPNRLLGGGYYPSLHGCVRDGRTTTLIPETKGPNKLDKSYKPT